MGSRAGSASSTRSATKLPPVVSRPSSRPGSSTNNANERGASRGDSSATGLSAKGDAVERTTEDAPRPLSPEVVLGSRNHPEEEDEMYGLRKMMRILGDEEQHNEKLLHGLNVLLAMSVVPSSRQRMVDRGALITVFTMLQQLEQDLFKLEKHVPVDPQAHFRKNEHAKSHQRGFGAPMGGAFESALNHVEVHRVQHSSEIETSRTRSLFPPLVSCEAKDEPFFARLDDTTLRKLSRPPSFVSQSASSGIHIKYAHVSRTRMLSRAFSLARALSLPPSLSNMPRQKH